VDFVRRWSEKTEIGAGRQEEIHAERDRKLEEARKQRPIRRQQAS